MSIFAIALLFGSAVLHTTWNLLLKQAGEKYIATWWAILLGSAFFLPFLFFTGLPIRDVWLLLAISVLVEVGYFIALSTAYQEADFSLVYPLARGAAPTLIALWSVLFLGEKFTPGGVVGLCIIISGLLITGGANLLKGSAERPVIRGVIFASILAVLISIYSTIDGAAVKRTPAFSYSVMIFFLAPVLTSPFMFHHYGWQKLKTELIGHKFRIVSIGLLSVMAYLVTLIAYGLSPVGYAGAIREVSVVMGALAGWRFLGERMGAWRVAGSVIIFCGIVTIAVFG